MMGMGDIFAGLGLLEAALVNVQWSLREEQMRVVVVVVVVVEERRARRGYEAFQHEWKEVQADR